MMMTFNDDNHHDSILSNNSLSNSVCPPGYALGLFDNCFHFKEEQISYNALANGTCPSGGDIANMTSIEEFYDIMAATYSQG